MSLKKWKTRFSLAIAVAMILTVLVPSKSISAETPISVADAIADNTGTKTVTGYIVGHTKSKNNYAFTPPFADDFNIAIADSPNETAPENILPVQLPSSFRADFGLKTNPDLIGKKVTITGSLEAYFTVPGLKSPTAIQFAGDADTPPRAEKAEANPSSGAVSEGTLVTLATNTPEASIYYTTDGSDPTAESTLYTEPIQIEESTTIKAIVIKEGLENSEVSSFEYRIAKDGLRIHDIQGKQHRSPYENEYVANVEGIVTRIVDNHNFYMQDPKPDSNPLTSEGLLVYKRDHGAQAGDLVKVNGQVKEWVLEGYSEKLKTDLPVTEINATGITVESSGNKLPTPVQINGLYRQPTVIIDNDGLTKFEPFTDGIDYYESLEGMRVSIKDAKVIAPQDYGELYVVAGNLKTNTSAGGLSINKYDYNPERIIVDIDDSSFVAKAGDSFKGTIEGVMSYGFSNFRILSDKEELPTFVEGKTKPETTNIKPDSKKLTVAAYNIENFSVKAGDEKITKLAQSMITNLKNPDIIGLVEVQDNDGSTDSGTTDASQNYQALADKIKELGGPQYAYTDIAPVNKEDGGAPGGNIRNGFLYNVERVQLVVAPKGTATEAVGYEDGQLTLNPGRIDPNNPAFEDSRKPLAAQFTFNGEDVIVVANHFNSKGGDHPLFGINQPAVLSSEAQRIEIAKVVNQFVKDVQAKDKNANIILLGDFNDFEFSAPMQALKGNELTNMIEKVPAKDRFTYTYQGNSQVLDHILVTNNLAKSTKADIVHINSVFMEEHGRVSDHDPVLIQTELKGKGNKKGKHHHKHHKGHWKAG